MSVQVRYELVCMKWLGELRLNYALNDLSQKVIDYLYVQNVMPLS